MDDTQVLKEFTDAGALLKGHFILTSGLRSDTYLQCARVLMDPKRAERLCGALAKKIKTELPDAAFDIVVAPAMGGVVVGYEMARQLGIPGIFCERVDGVFVLRRGFALEKGMRVLVVEDVVTTAKSSIETLDCIKSFGAISVAEASLVNRTNGPTPLPIPLISLLRVEVPTYQSDALPEHLKNIPAIKPGSRPMPA